jgi:phage-related protein
MDKEYSYEVLFYKDLAGNCPVEDFLDALTVKARAKAAKWIEKLEEFGPDLPRPYADIVRGKIRELRVIFASAQYRLLYFFCGKYIVITHGFTKKTNEVPDNELRKAENMMRDFEFRMKEGDVKI